MSHRTGASALAVLACSCIALLAPSVASAAPPPVHIHLLNAPSKCVDVKDSVNKAGQPLWLYDCSGAKDAAWDEVDGSTLNPSVDGFGDPCTDDGNCHAFRDVQDPSLCLGLNNSAQPALQTCDQTRNIWIFDGNGLRNQFWIDYYLVAASDTNGATLYGNHGTIDWWRWAGY